jgi:hypothetical protein
VVDWKVLIGAGVGLLSLAWIVFIVILAVE